jgi:DNA polymerase (family 10)
MVRACKERGYQYCAITDHSKAVRVAGGLTAQEFKSQCAEIVVAAVHSKIDMNQREMTKRVLKGLANPAVTILAHPGGRLINQREPFAIDLEEVFHAAKENDVAVELNAQPDRLDLNDLHVFRAREIGVKIAINTDAHSTGQLNFIRYGIHQARRGWLEKRHVLNTMTRPQLMTWLSQQRPKFDWVVVL